MLGPVAEWLFSGKNKKPAIETCQLFYRANKAGGVVRPVLQTCLLNCGNISGGLSLLSATLNICRNRFYRHRSIPAEAGNLCQQPIRSLLTEKQLQGQHNCFLFSASFLHWLATLNRVRKYVEPLFFAWQRLFTCLYITTIINSIKEGIYKK